MKKEDSIKKIKGIGEKTAEAYARLDVNTVGDLISYYPREYECYDEPGIIFKGEFGDNVVVYAKLCEVPKLVRARNLVIVSATWMDIKGNRFASIWYNQPYLCKTLHTGDAFVLRGIKIYKNKVVTIQQPQLYSHNDYSNMMNRLMPIYPLTKGLTRQAVIKHINSVIEDIESITSDIEIEHKLPKGYITFYQAVKEIHFPKNKESAEKARRRIVLEEFYTFFKKVNENIEKRENTMTEPMQEMRETDELMRELPFSLTLGQEQAWQEIRQEMSSGHVMHRLIQGDVGSGKTIIAFLAMVEVMMNNKQAVLMAPTSVLANQHFASFLRYFPQFEEKCVLLTGDTRAKAKIYDRIKSGDVNIVIGTHAVFQEKVEFDELRLVITDEQHRFGVKQRHDLADKGVNPHVLYMSATPIPRTLAGILYADLKVTSLMQKPAGRQKIHTCVISAKDRHKAYSFISKELLAGHQAYVICPLVEESELLSGENVTDYSKQLKNEFPKFDIGVMHGRMTAAEKDKNMLKFSTNQTQVLVSTTVVEVGVDVPNATVIMIENADRFGLAQLHQLRGRVGRGSSESYCILINSSEIADDSKRLNIMNESDDGFEIASKDFQIRGPGDILGIRQSGNPEFKLADIYCDTDIMEDARNII